MSRFGSLVIENVGRATFSSRSSRILLITTEPWVPAMVFMAAPHSRQASTSRPKANFERQLYILLQPTIPSRWLTAQGRLESPTPY